MNSAKGDMGMLLDEHSALQYHYPVAYLRVRSLVILEPHGISACWLGDTMIILPDEFHGPTSAQHSERYSPI